MKSFIIVVAFLVANASAYSLFQSEWDEWKTLHGKTYSYEEEIRRKFVWEDNLKKVIKHNEEAATGIHTYTLGMNHFADMTNDEYKSIFLGTKTRTGMGMCNKTFVASTDAHVEDKNVDWRTKGYVTPIKNQGRCGSCWAFSATGSLEGQHFKKTTKLVSLSEQNLMDCSWAEGDNACGGGLMDNAFAYVIKNGGVDTEMSYPYKENSSHVCNFAKSNVGATMVGCVDIAHGDEKALRQAVNKIGPISVAIDAGHPSFQLYKSGVYQEKTCSPVKLDHGVLAVGYGVDKMSGKKYWLVKNSWGEVWGQKGYIMMSRDNDNNCGIASQASYPMV